MDEERSSIDSAEEERAGSSSSAENKNDIAIAKVQAYMNHALMNDDVPIPTRIAPKMKVGKRRVLLGWMENRVQAQLSRLYPIIQ